MIIKIFKVVKQNINSINLVKIVSNNLIIEKYYQVCYTRLNCNCEFI